jgi:hypothetical protein
VEEIPGGIPGRNLPIEERLQSLALRPELASFDAGSINLGRSAFIPHYAVAWREVLTRGR